MRGTSVPPRAEAALQPLAWSHLPPAAQSLAASLDLTAANWSAWLASHRQSLAERIAAGSAEHVTYYLLQSRVFTAAPAFVPAQLAHRSPETMPPAAAARAQAFAASLSRPPVNPRHRLVADLVRAHVPDLHAAYRLTMAFLRAKEIDRSEPLDALYHRRGLSADSSPANLTVLDSLPAPPPRRILLAGPGLDLTRRQHFRDDLPLVSHQLLYLRRRYPQAAIDAVDVRPEVMNHLAARETDIVTGYLDGGYDLAIATNLLLYFADRELLTALAGLSRSLAPGGWLLHNDTRFAVKVFGDALGLPVREFMPRRLATTPRGVEQWDRAVLHRKVSL